MAKEETDKIISRKPVAAMVQGEISLAIAVANILKEKGVKVVVACSDRKVTERILPDGSTEKTATFTFEKFREI